MEKYIIKRLENNLKLFKQEELKIAKENLTLLSKTYLLGVYDSHSSLYK